MLSPEVAQRGETRHGRGCEVSRAEAQRLGAVRDGRGDDKGNVETLAGDHGAETAKRRQVDAYPLLPSILFVSSAGEENHDGHEEHEKV